MTTPIYKLLPIMAAWWAFSDVTSATTYDEYMTCGAGNGRYGRQYHRHSDLPCDLSKDTFCITPGTQYPWSAVRRFVYENQGLMKRMYGNQRHYNVLRAELLHDLYEEMYDEMPSRQRHRFHPPSSSAASSSSRTARYQKHSNANSLQTEERRKSEEDEENVDSLDRSRAIKIVKAEPEEYHRRTHQASSSSSSSSSSSHPPSYSSTTTLSSSKPRPESPGNRVKATSMASDKEAADTIEIKDEKLTTSQVTRINTKRPHTSPITSDPTTISMEGEAYASDGLHWSPGKEIEGETTTTDHGLPPLVERQQETEDNMWEHFEPTDFPLHPLDDIDIFGEDIWTTMEDQSFDTYSTPPTYSPDFDSTLSTVAQEMFTATPGVGTDPSEELSLDNLENWEAENLKTFTSTTPDIDSLTTLGTPARVFEEEVEVRTQGYGHERAEIDLKEEVDENNNPVKKGDFGEVPHNSQGAKEEEEEKAREEEKLEIERRENVPATNGVVHKDVLEDVKEQETTPEPMRAKRPVRGVNACPVKEEFVAPYWANNTRGETLALLNLYPFEQYIQWERCMYEHRQMYCRKGCRCEQQYRLHKLLAFDPTNECKGIFSDWFRFPSCCVCKCYDLPQDLFTATPRRPRHQFEKAGALKDNFADEDDADFYINDPDDGNDYAGVADDDDDEDDENIYDDARDETEEGGGEDNEGGQRKYLVRSGGRMVNIPPQRRPRQPPRPSSHITSLRATSSSSPSTAPPPPVSSTTLGTVDVATPYYYYNISHHARLLFANAQPFPLSRIPRSNPEV